MFLLLNYQKYLTFSMFLAFKYAISIRGLNVHSTLGYHISLGFEKKKKTTNFVTNDNYGVFI